MPKNVSGVKCVKCGFSFESDTYNSRNKKRKVTGRVFWEKYERYYQHVRERIELKRTDILCNSCHHRIDRCKTPPEPRFIDDIRILLLEAGHISLDIAEAFELDGTEKPEMSSVMSSSKLVRFVASQDGSPLPKRKRVGSKTVEKQPNSDESSPDDQNMEDTLDDNEQMTGGEMHKPVDAVAIMHVNACCQEFTPNKEIQMLENRSCTSADNSQLISQIELMGTINEMIEKGIFYNDELEFSTDKNPDLKVQVNRQILHLWLVRPMSTNYCRNSIQLNMQSASLLEQIMKFIHSGVTSSYEKFCKILGDQICAVANYFLVGLFFHECLLKFTDMELKEVVEKVERNAQSCAITKLILFCINNAFSLKTGLNDIFRFIEENFDVWNDSNLLDGDDVYNFSVFQKYCFYFWLYHKKNRQPSVGTVTHVVSSLKPSVTVEADECFEYVSLETNSRRNVRVHSLILHLRQEVNYREYLVNVNRTRSKISMNTYSSDSIHLFIEILYFGSNRFKKITNPQFCSTLIDLVQLFCIKHPLKLFGCEDCPNSAVDVRMILELYLKSGSQKYVECLLRKPRQYLKHDFVNLLHTRHMYNILIQDDLQLSEIEVYKLAIEFAENECCDDEDEPFKSTKGRLDKLLGAVRFGIMTNEEFKIVRSQSYLTQEERRDFFYLIHNPDEPVASSIFKFHKPTTKRRLVLEELKIQFTD